MGINLQEREQEHKRWNNYCSLRKERGIYKEKEDKDVNNHKGSKVEVEREGTRM